MPGSHLTVAERELIMTELASCAGSPNWTRIGHTVGRHRSTIQREVARNGGVMAYTAHTAQQRARTQACRSSTRFEREPQLATAVRKRLIRGESPYSIAIALGGVVCAETIYQGIYRGTLAVDATKVLRTRRQRRKHRHLRQPRNDGNFLGEFTSIHDRPASIDDRTIVGHWEGDLICGRANQSAVITLIERVTRYLVALQLPHGHSAQATIDALSGWVDRHPYRIKSLTWDQGGEMAHWSRLTKEHNITVYFCDPRSPWQRGAIEHANGLLRHWFPKGTDLSMWTQHDLDHACSILNHLHRRLLNNHTAHHLYHQQPRNKE